jgi:hypothetical protein
MAHGSKGPAPAAAPPAAPPAAPLNDAPPVNRKKQKRREKQAAKQAAEAQQRSGDSGRIDLVQSYQDPAAASRPPTGQPSPHYADPELDETHYDEEGEFYSEDDDDPYDHPYGTNGTPSAAYTAASLPANVAGKKPRKKKRGSSAAQQPQYHPPPLPRPAPASVKSMISKDRIWNTSTNEERERIREFWLSLGEEERKSLVKIEKEAVLRKMKEQQKHSCSCTVCGRKRTAIEEELEVLYDAYYEELEQYANPSSRLFITHMHDIECFLAVS